MTAKVRDVVRGNSKLKVSVAGLGDLSGPVGILPFNFLLLCVLLVLFWIERRVSNMP